MAENEKIEINKVQIADIHEAESELTQSDQEKVSGGGYYGQDTSGV